MDEPGFLTTRRLRCSSKPNTGKCLWCVEDFATLIAKRTIEKKRNIILQTIRSEKSTFMSEKPYCPYVVP